MANFETRQSGELENPAYEDAYLFQTLGYPVSLSVGREGERAIIRFQLEIYVDYHQTVCKNFLLFLDTDTPTVVAQFNVLRDSLRAPAKNLPPMPVNVQFSFLDEHDVEDVCVVYWIGMLFVSADTFPVVAPTYLAETVTDRLFGGAGNYWYGH